MASRSALMPSFETAPYIQYQKVQGLASVGGCMNCSRSVDCAPIKLKQLKVMNRTNNMYLIFFMKMFSLKKLGSSYVKKPTTVPFKVQLVEIKYDSSALLPMYPFRLRRRTNQIGCIYFVAYCRNNI